MKNPLKNKQGDWGIGRVIAVCVLLFLAFFTIFAGIRAVPSGYKGVRTQFGQIVGTADEGVHWVNIWFGQYIILMDLQIHKVTLGNLSCGTNDMQEVTTTISINYYIDSGYVTEIYRTLRTEWESRVIVNNMQESLKSTTSSFKAGELLQKREEVKVMFLDTLRSRLAQYHITVIDVQLEDYQFSEAFNKAIDEKTTAEQNAQTEKNKLEIVRYQQEQQILIKEAEATMMKIQAEAYANATLTRAQADATAIHLINEYLAENPEYLGYLYLLKWNGELPYFYGSDIPIPFFEIITSP